MKHAQRVNDSDRAKDTMMSGALDVPWARVHVEVRKLSLTWSRRALPLLVSAAEKKILDDVSIQFPPGQVTAILVGSKFFQCSLDLENSKS